MGQLKDAMNIGNIYKYPAQIIETRKENYLFPVAIINNKLVPARRNTEKNQSEVITSSISTNKNAGLVTADQSQALKLTHRSSLEPGQCWSLWMEVR